MSGKEKEARACLQQVVKESWRKRGTAAPSSCCLANHISYIFPFLAPFLFIWFMLFWQISFANKVLQQIPKQRWRKGAKAPFGQYLAIWFPAKHILTSPKWPKIRHITFQNIRFKSEWFLHLCVIFLQIHLGRLNKWKIEDDFPEKSSKS